MLLLVPVKSHHPKLFFVLLCHEFFVLEKQNINSFSFQVKTRIMIYLLLAVSIFCLSVLVLSLLIGFFKPNAAHIRRFAVKDDVCGRVLYG